jgi:hypothetical protein
MSQREMKKLIFCALLFSFKTSFAQIKLEALAGYNDVNLSNMGRLPFKDYQYYSSINSFQVGAAVEMPLGRKWFLEPALLYFGNGTHISEQSLNPGIDWDINVTERLYYLRIPVNFIYKTHIGQSFQVFAGVGLYFARGLWGKETGQIITEGASTSSQTVNNSVKFRTGTSSDWTNPSFNPYDLGYTILAGIEWGQFKLTSSISNGLIKTYSGYNYDLWNSTFSVYLTYQFAVIH